MGCEVHLAFSDIQNFYSKTELGLISSRFINESIKGMDKFILRNAERELLVGYGYPKPYMKTLMRPFSKSMCLMDEKQGTVNWPENVTNRAMLIEQSQWPLESETTNIVMMIHGLETCENPNELLEEIWRVLVPEGYLLLVVPNRTGFWARSDLTPFGHGRPYSLSQLTRLLGVNRFQIMASQASLFTPPSSRKFFLKSSALLERIGKKYATKVMGGVIIMLAKKQIHAPTALKITDSMKVPFGLFDGLIDPKPKPLPNDRRQYNYKN